MKAEESVSSGPQSLSPSLHALRERFDRGERAALARAISVVENERPGFQLFLDALLRRRSDPGRRIGITGPPGAGKSTLVAALAQAFRNQGEEVGVVAVDPSSPFTGGALLGDRIRMNEVATDSGIFIRSMASRGSLGGLATTTNEVLDVLDAFGFPRLLAETVGVGQAELEIAGATDSVVVALVPESGDGIQAMKAGLMEIADVFVVNKADRAGADRLVNELRIALRLRRGEAMRDIPAHHGVRASDGAKGARAGDGESRGTNQRKEEGEWKVPIVKTVATSSEGVAELVEGLEAHWGHLTRSGELAVRRWDRARGRVRAVVERELRRAGRRHLETSPSLASGLEGIAEGTATPYTVAAVLLRELGVGAAAERLPRPEEAGGWGGRPSRRSGG